MTPELLKDLALDEGYRTHAYPDPLSPLARECRRLKISNRNTFGYRRIPNWTKFSAAPWTIGIGHTGADVQEGMIWTDAQIKAAFEKDAVEHAELLLKYEPWVAQLDPVRQDALFNMVFNMGYNPNPKAAKKGLAGFKNSLGLIRAGKYREAGAAMSKSAWFNQVGDRAKRVIRMITHGDRNFG